MNLLTKTACGLFLCGTLIMTGCGDDKSAPTVTFSSLYQTAAIDEQYNTEFEQAAINSTDDLMVNHRESLEQIIALQKKIDNGNSQLVQQMKNALISYYDDYGFKLNSYTILNMGDNKGFRLYDRPTKFYQLYPDKEGKFGDHFTATLREIKKFGDDSSKGSDNYPEILARDFFLKPVPLMSDSFQLQEAVWEPSNKDQSMLWTKDNIYLMSGIHDDKKNHNSICILATPGDIAEGMVNGSFPIQEDMSFELLQSFLTFYNEVYVHLPPEIIQQAFVPEATDKNFVKMSDDDSAFFYVPSLKKLDSTGGDKVYSIQMRFTTGMWGRMKLRTIYIRFRKDGTREWSFNDGHDYYKLNVEWVKKMADYIAKKEGIR